MDIFSFPFPPFSFFLVSFCRVVVYEFPFSQITPFWSALPQNLEMYVDLCHFLPFLSPFPLHFSYRFVLWIRGFLSPISHLQTPVLRTWKCIMYVDLFRSSFSPFLFFPFSFCCVVAPWFSFLSNHTFLKLLTWKSSMSERYMFILHWCISLPPLFSLISFPFRFSLPFPCVVG